MGEDIAVGLELGLQSAIARMAQVNRVRDAKETPPQLVVTGFVVDRELLQRLTKVASSVPDVSESHKDVVYPAQTMPLYHTLRPADVERI